MRPRIWEVQAHVAAHYGLRLRDLTGRRRVRGEAHPRQVAMYLAREMTGRSYPLIGRHFGGRDHSTAHYACAAVARRAGEDPALAHDLDLLRARIRDGTRTPELEAVLTIARPENLEPRSEDIEAARAARRRAGASA